MGPFKNIKASQDAFSELQTKGYVRYENLPLETKDGESLAVEFVSNVYDVDHKRVIQCNIRDITKRKQAEERLREEKERYRSLFENMLDGFAYCRMLFEDDQPQDFIYLAVNDAFEKLTGLKDVVGKKVTAVIPGIKESNPELFEIYGRVALSGEAERFETYLKPLDEWFSVVVYSPEKGCFVAVFDIITARKRAEKKLNDSERLYRAIGESIDYGIWVCDPDGRNTYASESFLKLVGLTQDQCSEFGWGNVLHPEDAERTIAAWKECVRTRCNWDMEHRFRGVDGQWHPILARGVSVHDQQGKLICWAGINLDISGLKQMEEELRKSRDELEMRVQERTEELANSHQRLQQLSSQLLLAQEKERKRVAVELHDGLLSELAATKYLLEGKMMLLEKGKLSGPGEFKRVLDTLGIVMREARRIMNNLHPSILDELGLIAVINWLSGEYQKSYPHIKVHRQIEVSEQEISEGLRIVIFRVLQEALNNFAKHGNGDRVDMFLLKSGKGFLLKLQDNGQGFDVENSQRGLGLESMRERVELSGGEFQIESIIGQGTTIRAIWSC